MNRFIGHSRHRVLLPALLTGLVLLRLGAQAQGRKVLDTVRARGQLVCGVLGTIYGFSLADSGGVMRGIDADSCRAIAAAVLGGAAKVRFVALPTQNRFTAVQSGEVDVLYAKTTWTYSLDARLMSRFESRVPAAG